MTPKTLEEAKDSKESQKSQNSKSFIEVQFPVSKISKESYKERKAGSGQTLTSFGKWWGRKPLILVRAAILGMLMPASEDPAKDRDIFLKLLTMDEEGLLLRKKSRTKPDTPTFKKLSYDEKLKYCKRPEELEDLTDLNWKSINDHLGTTATSLQELIEELGIKKFGHRPVVGDCFCGGGSIPFEAARIGCDVVATDLNPVACLLTWASINISGSSKEEIEELKNFQEKIYNLADQQIQEWGIETNEQGWRANAYLYCNETKCPECEYMVPLAPSWLIGENSKTIAKLKVNHGNKDFDIEIESGVGKDELNQAKTGTISNSSVNCPQCKTATPILSIRKDRKKTDGDIQYGLRRWKPEDIIPNSEDIFQERLYCIRYEDQLGKRVYTKPTREDLRREDLVLEILAENFSNWQSQGYIPSSEIIEGVETTRLVRERGWTHWHHLFNARQLVINSLLLQLIIENSAKKSDSVIGLLGLHKVCDNHVRLCTWHQKLAKIERLFSNQAFNTMFNYGSRAFGYLKSLWEVEVKYSFHKNSAKIFPKHASDIEEKSDFWITDPPYADAVNYHELSEFFLAWDKTFLPKIFPEWYADSKRALAVKGTGSDFNHSMIEVYRNLANHMPDNGMQMVMFTHQDTSVWADLTLILWSAGLRVTAAWNIATETESGGLKDGNYVKGTVLMILRKQDSKQTAFIEDISPQIEEEVKAQIDSMRDIDDKDDPDFSDPDYLLAAYAASLKVLTSYKSIEDVNIEYELSRSKNIKKKEISKLEKIIKNAVKVAYDYLIPVGFEANIWRSLSPEERFYIKGIEFEKNNIHQLGAYQELARGYGVQDYKFLLASTKANQVRLKTPSEFAGKQLNGTDAFSNSLLRNILMSIYVSSKQDDTEAGRNWLKTELADYWQKRNAIIEILRFMATLQHISSREHWDKDLKQIEILLELVKNDGV